MKTLFKTALLFLVLLFACITLYCPLVWGNPYLGLMSKGVAASGGGGDYTVDNAMVYEDSSPAEGYYKVCIYDASDNNLVACSDAKLDTGAGDWAEVSFTDGPSLDTEKSYRIGVIVDGNATICYYETWKSRLNTSGTFSSPPSSIDPSSDAAQALGQLAIHLRNSSGTVLMGLTGSSFTCNNSGISNNELKYRYDAYECCNNE